MKNFRPLSQLAARCASDKKAEEIVLLHIKPLSGLADYLLLATVDSPAHMEAVQYQIEHEFKDKGVQLLRRDGLRSDRWRVLDYGGLLVHLMHRETREFYSIDKLYVDARKMEWEEPAKPAAKPARKKSPAKGRRRA